MRDEATETRTRRPARRRLSTKALGVGAVTSAALGLGIAAVPAQANAPTCTYIGYTDGSPTSLCGHSYWYGTTGYADYRYDGFDEYLYYNSAVQAGNTESVCVREVVHPGQASAFDDTAKCERAYSVAHYLNGDNIDKGICYKDSAPLLVDCNDDYYYYPDRHT